MHWFDASKGTFSTAVWRHYDFKRFPYSSKRTHAAYRIIQICTYVRTSGTHINYYSACYDSGAIVSLSLEAQLLQRLRHPQIVSCYDVQHLSCSGLSPIGPLGLSYPAAGKHPYLRFDPSRKCVWLALEFMDGGDLGNHIKARRLHSQPPFSGPFQQLLDTKVREWERHVVGWAGQASLDESVLHTCNHDHSIILQHKHTLRTNIWHMTYVSIFKYTQVNKQKIQIMSM